MARLVDRKWTLEESHQAINETQEDDALRIKQLVSIIRKLRHCPHGCASPCSHSTRFNKAIEMLQPELRRRILND
jgi:hypothetical protein